MRTKTEKNFCSTKYKRHMTLFSMLIFFISSDIFSQHLNKAKKDFQDDYEPVPVTTFFHRLDDHVLGSFTRDYGIPHIAAIIGSYGMVESGLDWEVVQLFL
ncbi:MAG: hypothetical protein U5K00_18860 [Melioribacteraceae bacterium]|nr:hypothetical protein [Melioribacteraceae bacterium]